MFSLRQVNVDFSIMSGLQTFYSLLLWVVGYDIMCQYAIHLKERIERYVAVRETIPELQVIPAPNFPDMILGIGKLHLAAHTMSCRFKFSMHWLPGVGVTDSEAPERNWAIQNGISSRTREMNAGHRHDTINDFYNDLNFRRTNEMRKYLLYKSADEADVWLYSGVPPAQKQTR